MVRTLLHVQIYILFMTTLVCFYITSRLLNVVMYLNYIVCCRSVVIGCTE